MGLNKGFKGFTIMGFLILAFLLLAPGALFARDVTLQWDPNPASDDVAYYTVHFGTSSGTYTQSTEEIPDTSYTLTIPDDGQTYYFVVTATDQAGLTSDYSNEVNTADGDGAISDAETPPGAPGTLTKVKMVKTGPDGTTYTFEGNILTIKYPDGTIVTLQ